MSAQDGLAAQTPDILKRILERKCEEITERAARESLRDLGTRAESASPPRGFARALHAKLAANEPVVIAEIKRASPSNGLLR